jgi:hypothetical protein
MQSSPAEHGAGDQTWQFLGLAAECPRLVGPMIEREESLDADMAAAEDFVVRVCAEFLKVFETVSNWLSRENKRAGAAVHGYQLRPQG